MKILAFDPGVTTGYACYKNGVLTDYGEFPNFQSVRRLIEQNQPTIILYESFHLIKLSINPTPLEVIGVIKFLAQENGLRLIDQRPDRAKFVFRRFPDEMKKVKHHWGDAVAHIVYYLYQNTSLRPFPGNEEKFPLRFDVSSSLKTD